jgi:hypothetical protein
MTDPADPLGQDAKDELGRRARDAAAKAEARTRIRARPARPPATQDEKDRQGALDRDAAGLAERLARRAQTRPRWAADHLLEDLDPEALQAEAWLRGVDLPPRARKAAVVAALRAARTD